MRCRVVSLAIATLLAAPWAAQAARAASDADAAITHVAVIDIERGRVVPDQTVLLRGSRIVSVEPSAQVQLAANVRVIDGTNQYVMPGLWDMHAHLHSSGMPFQIEIPLLVANGVTGVRIMAADRPSASPNVTSGLDQHRAAQAQIEAGRMTGPRLMALGTWPVNGAVGISDSMPDFYKAQTADQGRRLARYFKERGFDFIKIYNDVSREGFFGLAEEARRLGMPFAGHEPSLISAIELSNAGQKSIEHSRIFLENCFAGADSLRRGLMKGVSETTLRRRMVDECDPMLCAEVLRVFARNGTYITPTHVTRRMDAFADDSAYRHDRRMKYIPLAQQRRWLADADRMVASDSSRAGRKSFMDFYRKGLELTNAAYRAGVPVMLGTDAGDSFVFPGASVHDELGELVRAGLSPAEALRAATLTGAAYLGRTADFGTVQSGRMADLLLLDANPLDDISNSRRIHAVILNGRLFDRAALDSMLVAVEAAARPSAQAILWVASAAGDTAAILEALAAGASIDSLDTATTASGRRPLNYAAFNNRAAAVRLLIARGATLNAVNRTGFTPVHHAAEAGAVDALRVLIAAGADVTIPNARGKRPLQTAREHKAQAVVQALQETPKTP